MSARRGQGRACVAAIATVAGLLVAGTPARAAEPVTAVQTVQAPFGGNITDVAYSPDGRLLAAASETIEGARVNGKLVNRDELRIYTVGGDDKLKTVSGGTASLRRGASAQALAFSPNGNLVVVADQSARALRTFDVSPSGRIGDSSVTSTQQPGPNHAGPTEVAFSPGGGIVAALSYDHWLSTYRVTSTGGLVKVTGGSVQLSTSIGSGPSALAFSPDGRYVQASDPLCGCTRAYAVNSAGALKLAATTPESFDSFAFRPTGGGAAFDSYSYPNGLFTLAPGTGGKLGARLSGTRTNASQLAYTPGGGRLLGAELSREEPSLYDVDPAGRLRTLHQASRASGGYSGATSISVSPDGGTAATTSLEFLKGTQGVSAPAFSHVGVWRISPADPPAKVGGVGVAYPGLSFTAGEVDGDVSCTASAPCSWSLMLPSGLKATTAVGGGATVLVGGAARKLGTFKGTGTLRQGGKTRGKVAFTIRIVGPPSVTLASPAEGEQLRLGRPATVAYECTAQAGTRLAPTGGCDGTLPHRAALDTDVPGPKTFTVSSRDAAGNVTTVTHHYDVVAPPTVAIDRPVDGAVLRLGQAVSATYACAAGLSGTVTRCEGTLPVGAALDTATPGEKSFTVTAVDRLGQTATRTVTYTVVAPPSAQITTPSDGGAYPVGAVVTAQYACDAAPGGTLAAADGCTGTLPVGARIDTSAPGARTFTVTATDALGQTATVTSSFRVVAGPSATITTPAQNGTYALGATVPADFTCAAGPGGTLKAGGVGCTGTVAAGASIDTATPGVKTFTVTATDALGQTFTATRTYTVVPPPTVTIPTPAEGATYDTANPPTVAFSCTAGAGGALLAGSAGCSGTQPAGATLAATPLGARTFTVTATDALGQTTTVTRHFTVAVFS